MGALLAASTGVVGATVVTMGLISLPAMLRAGYDPKLASGVICASGTLGQIILSGAKEVRIHGTLVPVRATIRSMGNYSAHADHTELMDWIAQRLPAHGALFLTHGEDEERHALREAPCTCGIQRSE